MIGFFTRIFTAAGQMAVGGVSALFDMFGKLSGGMLFPALEGIAGLLSLTGKFVLRPVVGLFEFDPLDFCVHLGEFGFLAIGDFFSAVSAKIMSLFTGWIDIGGFIEFITKLPIPTLILGQIKMVINLLTHLPGLVGKLTAGIHLSANLLIDAVAGIKLPDIQIRFEANGGGGFGFLSLFDLLKPDLNLLGKIIGAINAGAGAAAGVIGGVGGAIAGAGRIGGRGEIAGGIAGMFSGGIDGVVSGHFKPLKLGGFGLGLLGGASGNASGSASVSAGFTLSGKMYGKFFGAAKAALSFELPSSPGIFVFLSFATPYWKMASISLEDAQKGSNPKALANKYCAGSDL